MRRMRVYCAGSYSAPDVISVLDNMRRGMQLGYEVITNGFAPFVPWFDYHFSLIGPMELQEYLDYSMAWLEASDAVLLVPGWEESKGTKKEIDRARALGIPVFYSMDQLKAHREYVWSKP